MKYRAFSWKFSFPYFEDNILSCTDVCFILIKSLHANELKQMFNPSRGLSCTNLFNLRLKMEQSYIMPMECQQCLDLQLKIRGNITSNYMQR